MQNLNKNFILPVSYIRQLGKGKGVTTQLTQDIETARNSFSILAPQLTMVLCEFLRVAYGVQRPHVKTSKLVHPNDESELSGLGMDGVGVASTIDHPAVEVAPIMPRTLLCLFFQTPDECVIRSIEHLTIELAAITKRCCKTYYIDPHPESGQQREWVSTPIKRCWMPHDNNRAPMFFDLYLSLLPLGVEN